MDAITLTDLCFTYINGNNPVLKNLSLTFPQGGITAILGPNGAGKTTLLYCILGMLKPGAGEMQILGKPRNQYSEKQIKQLIGMVTQGEFIPFDLSVMEYVLLGRAPHLHLLRHPGPNDIAVAKEALKTVGLENLSDRAVPLLSSGEKQLAAVARCLTQAPEILLFDEPTSHLDLSNSRRILTRMKTIARAGRTILFTTHDPNAAVAIADYVVLLGKERLVAAGCIAETMTEGNISETYGESVEIICTNRGLIVLSLKV